jgi:hypothetical protein
VSPLTITTAGTYEIAPDWFLELTGAGTQAIITQEIYPADTNAINKPPYALRFDLDGWDSAKLYQRFSGNGAIWASVTTPTQDTAIAASITALAETTPQQLAITYVPSTGTPVPIASDTVGIDVYQVVQGAVTMPVSDNTELNDVAYVDIVITLPPDDTINISNVQVVGQDIPLPITYEQETIERQVDHLFHYYANQLITKPKQTLLTGWNFSLNPFQFNATALTTASSQTQYIADQTIIYQEAASRVQTGKSAFLTARQGLEIKAINGATNNRFALIQYIDPRTCQPYWGKILSSMARVRIYTTHDTQVRIKMRLITSGVVPVPISATQPIASWSANSDPTFAAQWSSVIAPLNDPAYVLLNNDDTTQGIDAFPGFAFDRFNAPANDGANNTMAIVLYTMDDMDQTLGEEDSIVFDSISLVPNLFAVDAPPQTFDECLRECQYYFEKSYESSVLAGTNTLLGAQEVDIPIMSDGSQTQGYRKRIFQRFKQVKRIPPATVAFYTPAGTLNNVSFTVVDAGTTIQAAVNLAISGWTQENISTDSMAYKSNDGSLIYQVASDHLSYEGFLQFHYVIDSRLGI